ncbi:MAG: AraC family transcriptional regulator [Terrimicrobiaceae bacterium]|nr:AraC family transcriptional regulator [Terrimicrobiaceae bacterium]
MKAISHTSGFKHFFAPNVLKSADIEIHGIGVREWMPPCMVERPHGTGDHLIMVFHQPVAVGSRPGPKPVEGTDAMMIWPPGRGQYYGNRTARFCHTWIHCEGRRLDRILRRAGLPVLKPFLLPDASLFQQCLLDIHAEMVAYARPDTVIVGNLIENCIRRLGRVLRGKGSIAPVPENLLAARRLIGSASARPLTLSDLASAAGMSAPYFCSSFKKAFGLPPVECLIQHRMHHAAHLLTNRNLTISEVAAQAGYDDLFHFSKMFKKRFGVSPREMRKRRAGFDLAPAATGAGRVRASGRSPRLREPGNAANDSASQWPTC